MCIMHPRAGQPAQPEDLVDIDALLAAYDEITPDVENPAQKVVFGTSGHRGSSLDGAFNEAHILAITQAICEYRAGEGTTGPLLVGRDSHGLSEPAWRTVLEVLAGQRRTDPGGQRGPADADPWRVARDPAAQPRCRRRCRRHRHHAVAQPAAGRRHQVQPAARRPGRLRRDRLDRVPGERADRRRQPRGTAEAVRGGPVSRRGSTTSSVTTSTTCPRCSTWTRSAPPASGSARTRSAARAWTTGPRSPSGTGST